MGSVPVGIKNALVCKEKPCELQKYGNMIVSSSGVVSSVAVGNYFSPFYFNLKVKGKIFVLPTYISLQRWKVEVGVGFACSLHATTCMCA